VHSSAHDKRRHKRIDRMLKQDRKQLEADVKAATSTAYYCREDAETAGEKLIHKSRSGYHRLQIDVEKVAKYGRGRPAAGKPRKVLRYEYHLTATITEAPEKVTPLREEAGCFVLLTNLVDQQEDWSAQELLSHMRSSCRNFNEKSAPLSHIRWPNGLIEALFHGAQPGIRRPGAPIHLHGGQFRDF
jgi:hypothetical protein